MGFLSGGALQHLFNVSGEPPVRPHYPTPNPNPSTCQAFVQQRMGFLSGGAQQHLFNVSGDSGAAS